MDNSRGRGIAGRGRGLPLASRGRGLVSNPPVGTVPPNESEARQLGRGRGLQATPAASAAPAAPATTAASIGRGRGLTIGLSQASTTVASSLAVARTTPTAEPDKRLSIGISLKDLESTLDVATMTPLYRRPGTGTKGREIGLLSNLFKIEFSDMIWYKYDVEISTATETSVELKTAGACNKDRVQSRRFNHEIISAVFRKNAADLQYQLPSYDGRKTLISSKNLGNDRVFSVDMERNDYGRSRQFIVMLKLTIKIDVSQVQRYYRKENVPLNPEIIQAANIVIDSTLSQVLTAVNRAYYDTQKPSVFPLSGGKELRSGIYTSVIFAEWQPLLIVDKANTSFYTSQNLIDYIGDFFNDSKKYLNTGLTPHQLNSLSKDLKGLMMRLTHSKMGRSIKVAGISSEPANKIIINRSESCNISVADYFAESYGRLKYPHLPCVTVLKANKTKTDYYPFETCEIKENQPYRKKLNPRQTQNMIRNCQEKPNERIKKAIQGAETVQSLSRNSLAQHGLKVDIKPIQTIGRQIDSPQIQVKKQSIPVHDGKWRQDEFHEGASLSQWLVVDCANCGPLAVSMAKTIRDKAQSLKLQSVREPLAILKCAGWPTERILTEVKKHFKITNVPLMAVIILDIDTSYSQIKLFSETKIEFQGIITQCVRAENVRTKGSSHMFVGNLLKKMNAKLGGINNSIKTLPKRFSSAPYIVIGADVNHPGVGDFLTPSIAAVVGSLDAIPSKYHTEIRVQTNVTTNRIEYIKDLKDIVKILLLEFFRLHNRKPEHIYYFRDGVSEGQFDDVRNREITALRQACVCLEADYKPPMTVVIAQKRHHTRFTVIDQRHGTRSGNVPPGTYIDRDVVHPENFDLYMYTHQGLLGTSRPTHYHLIHADEPITTDELTEIIYHLCHCYARTSSSVSIPAPIYYAHLAAYRAKEHVKGDINLALSDSYSVSSGDAPSLDLALYQKTCNVHEKYRNFLYYA